MGGVKFRVYFVEWNFYFVGILNFYFVDILRQAPVQFEQMFVKFPTYDRPFICISIHMFIHSYVYPFICFKINMNIVVGTTFRKYTDLIQ